MHVMCRRERRVCGLRHAASWPNRAAGQARQGRRASCKAMHHNASKGQGRAANASQ
jgi:hypothetical protein